MFQNSTILFSNTLNAETVLVFLLFYQLRESEEKKILCVFAHRLWCRLTCETVALTSVQQFSSISSNVAIVCAPFLATLSSRSASYPLLRLSAYSYLYSTTNCKQQAQWGKLFCFLPFFSISKWTGFCTSERCIMQSFRTANDWHLMKYSIICGQSMFVRFSSRMLVQ